MSTKSNWVDAILYLLKPENINNKNSIYFWLNNMDSYLFKFYNIVDIQINSNFL